MERMNREGTPQQPFGEVTRRCRLAQRGWATQPVRRRLRPVRAFRRLLVEAWRDLAEAARKDIGRPPEELLATDFLPTADACRFLE
ncbi:MAG TPA: hypothetical protein VIL46_11535, partial [Gemmataceae bacterium]